MLSIFFNVLQNLGEEDEDSNENTDTESEDNEKLHMSSLSWIGDMEVGVDQVFRKFSSWFTVVFSYWVLLAYLHLIFLITVDLNFVTSSI